MALQKTRLETVVNSDWEAWCRKLLDLYSTKKHFYKDDLHSASHFAMYKWILGEEFTGIDLILRNLLLDAMMSADKYTPGSGVYVPWYLFNSEKSSSAYRQSSSSYLNATLSLSKSEECRELFKIIYQNVGPLTKIIAKPSYESNTVIKYRNSFNFPLPLDPQFHRIIGQTEHIELTNPIVIMIEGAPETVGEINSLLQWNHEQKRPVVLIARSFPEEISATLATNWIRNSLNILPIPYGNSIESINLAADMCAITKGELISAHFGDIISAALLNEDKWGEVDRIEWSSHGISIYKDVDVRRHVNNIIEKSKKVEQEELQNLYKERILSLSNDAIEVWIDNKNNNIIEEIDSLIKHYNAFVTSGIVKTNIGLLPKSFQDAAKESAASFRNEILNIGGFLVGVNDEVVVG